MTDYVTCGNCWCTVPTQSIGDHHRICPLASRDDVAQLRRDVVEALRWAGTPYRGGPVRDCLAAADRLASPPEPAVELPTKEDWDSGQRGAMGFAHFDRWKALSRLISEGKTIEIRDGVCRVIS